MRPSRRLLQLTALTVLLAVPWVVISLATDRADTLALSLAFWLWLLPAGALGLAALFDALQLRTLPSLTAKRHMPRALSLRRQEKIRLEIQSHSNRAEQLLVTDHHPGDDSATSLPVQLTTTPGHIHPIDYLYTPGQRGAARFGLIELWRTSRLGLWQQKHTLGEPDSVPVYPDFTMLNTADINAASHKQELGVHTRQRRGEGMEFHQLREYRSGDSMRRIDWKATARRHTLISREYQDEENQPVLMLLDGGLRMRSVSAGLSVFDHALHAALLLAWHAQKEGDRPGALLFAHSQSRWVAPQRGRHAVNRLLNQFYDIHAGDQVSDYSDAARALLKRQRKRALVVIMTHLHPQDEQELTRAVHLLRQHHLVLVADLQPPEARACVQQPVTTFDQALACTTAVQQQQALDTLMQKLTRRGAFCISGTPRDIPQRLSQRYLDMKRAGLL